MNIDKNRKIRDAHRTFVYKTVGNVEKILTEHVEDLTSFREKFESLGVEVNILGDLNCNVAACPLELHIKNLLELCDLYQYHQLINKHTRITAKSATTIDLFLTNNKEMFTFSGVCHIGISDHSLIYGVRKFCFPKGEE